MTTPMSARPMRASARAQLRPAPKSSCKSAPSPSVDHGATVEVRRHSRTIMQQFCKLPKSEISSDLGFAKVARAAAHVAHVIDDTHDVTDDVIAHALVIFSSSCITIQTDKSLLPHLLAPDTSSDSPPHCVLPPFSKKILTSPTFPIPPVLLS